MALRTFIYAFLFQAFVVSCAAAEAPKPETCLGDDCTLDLDLDDVGLNLLQRSSVKRIQAAKDASSEKLAKGASQSVIAEKKPLPAKNAKLLDATTVPAAQKTQSTHAETRVQKPQPATVQDDDGFGGGGRRRDGRRRGFVGRRRVTAIDKPAAPSDASTAAPSDAAASTAAPSDASTAAPSPSSDSSDSDCDDHGDGDGDGDGDDDHDHSNSTGHARQHRHEGHHKNCKQVCNTWWCRMERSFVWVILGIIMIVFAFPVLWYNEKRSAQFQSLIAAGEAEVQTVTADKSDAMNHNSLVHVLGGKLVAAKPVECADFNVRFEKGCLKLATTIEVYQWVEKEEKAKEQKGGGRPERGGHGHGAPEHGGGGGGGPQSTFTYTKEWSCFYNDGSKFHDKSHKNTKPAEIHPDPIGSMMNSAICERVEYGTGFLLPKGLVDGAAVTKPWNAQQDVTLKKSGNKLKKASGGEYCSGDLKSPQIGDIKVKFEMAPDGGTASVLALQVEQDDMKAAAKDGRATFLPYRNIRRNWCGGESPDKLKQDRRDEGKKDLTALAEEQGGKLTGCLGFCCCACTIVEMCMLAVFHPELYEVMPGNVDSKKMFDEPKKKDSIMTWGFRLLGWLLMFIGLGNLFGPFLTFITIIPFLGPLIAGLGGIIVWVFSFLVTLVICIVIVALAYSVYNPKVTFICLAIIGGIVALIMICSPGAPAPVAAAPAPVAAHPKF